MKRIPPSNVQALCYDFRSAVSARILSFDEDGCDLASLTPSSDAVFPRKCQLLVRLHDQRTGQAVNVRAKLSAFIRDQGTWVYRLRWDESPTFLTQLADSEEETPKKAA